MLVGYMRVSKADGSQVTDLQRDALLAAGVDAQHIYEDAASGKRDDRPGLAAGLRIGCWASEAHDAEQDHHRHDAVTVGRDLLDASLSTTPCFQRRG